MSKVSPKNSQKKPLKPSQNTLPTVLLSVGGTGGHIYPALEVAKDLQKEKIEAVIVGIDIKKWENLLLGFRVISLKKPKSIIDWLSICIKGVRICRKEQPSLIVGFGSYHSVPCVLGGFLTRINYALYEPNAVFGRVNRLFYRYSHWVATYFLKKKHKKIHRLTIPKKATKQDKDIDLLIVGGSLGASFFNTTFPLLLKGFQGKVVHITGKNKKCNEVKKVYKHLQINCECIEYSDDMLSLLERSRCAIIRAGASMLCEVISQDVPSLIIPLETAVNNHQYENSVSAKDRGDLFLIREKEIKQFTGEEFQEKIKVATSRSELKEKSRSLRDECLQETTLTSLILDHLKRNSPQNIPS